MALFPVPHHLAHSAPPPPLLTPSAPLCTWTLSFCRLLLRCLQVTPLLQPLSHHSFTVVITSVIISHLSTPHPQPKCKLPKGKTHVYLVHLDVCSGPEYPTQGGCPELHWRNTAHHRHTDPILSSSCSSTTSTRQPALKVKSHAPWWDWQETPMRPGLPRPHAAPEWPAQTEMCSRCKICTRFWRLNIKIAVKYLNDFYIESMLKFYYLGHSGLNENRFNFSCFFLL